MRKLLVLTAAVVAFGGLVAPTAPVGAAAPYCGITWGSLAKLGGLDYTTGPITNLRAGRHPCFDRLVIDLATPLGPPGRPWNIQYVSRVVQVPSARPVTISGGAFINVTILAPDDPRYRPTYLARLHAVNVAGYSTFRQVALLGSHEAQSQIVIGVRARLPFRVFALSGPGSGSRIVIDVAHRW